MLASLTSIYQYRELLAVLTWKNVTLRYKQSHLGLLWVIFKPLVMVVIFMLVRSFVGIDSGDIPYPLLTYCALIPWVFFQESAADGVGSVVNNANLIRKIYFPREIFPLAAIATKMVELCIGLVILALMMLWYGVAPSLTMLWAPVILLVTVLTSLTLAFVGSALNVYSRDVAQMVPLALSLLMYASPIMYPLTLVKKKLLVEQAAGSWSDALYTLYSINPMAGIVESFQRVMLHNQQPDWATLMPGLALVAVCLPLSYLFFKQAEAYFADVI
jgi:lipopolysaccharide transport system permease protein